MTLFDPTRTPPRDLYGHYAHPDLDQFFDGEEGDEGPLDYMALRSAGFEMRSLFISEQDFPDDDAYDRFCDAGDPNVSWWNPEVASWQRVGIWDTEDGAMALFVRPVN